VVVCEPGPKMEGTRGEGKINPEKRNNALSSSEIEMKNSEGDHPAGV